MLHQSSSVAVADVINIGSDYELREALRRSAKRLSALCLGSKYDISNPSWQLVIAIELVIYRGNPSFEDYCGAMSALAITDVHQELIQRLDVRYSWNEVWLAVMGWDPTCQREVAFSMEDFVRPVE